MSGLPAFSAAHSSAWIHYALATDDPGGAVSRSVAWLRPPAAESDVVVSLAESWEAGGVYVFLGRPGADDRRLVAALRGWLEDQPGGVRLLWIADPGQPSAAWQTQAVRVGGTGPGGGTVAAGARPGGGGYGLVLTRGARVTPAADPPGFDLAPPADSTGALALSAPDFAQGLPVRAVRLPLRGPDAGALAFDLEVGAAADGPDPLALLDAGLRYYHPAPSPAGGDGVGTIRYPVLDLRGARARFEGRLDPADPRADRAGLAFAPDTPPLPSFFRTVSGRAVALAPSAGAGFRFAPFGPMGRGEAPGRLTLVPSGAFSIAPGAEGAELLCGTSGVETVVLPGAGATLRFVPGGPAWAPLFNPGPQPDGEGAEAPRLGLEATTAWVALSGDAPLVYRAQPRDAVLHAAGAEGLLDYFPVAAGLLVPADGDPGSAALPLVPYGGVAPADAAAAAALEVEALAPERRERIFDRHPSDPGPRLTASGDGDGSVTAVTPGGYVATFAADRETWESLVLARVGGQRLAFEAIQDPLRAALLTSSQFLVVSDPAALAGHLGEDAVLTLDGWTFDLRPEGWSRHGTILILKSCDRPLAELVEDVGTWVLPDAFNVSPARTQAALEAMTRDARDRAEDAGEREADPDEPWGRFVRTVVDDPGWNGWLAFRCPVPPASLPPGLAELAAGLDETRFFAHHLGLRQGTVPAPGGEPAESSLFGLVAYEDELRPPPAGRDQAFQVVRMDAAFSGSAVQSFSAGVALTLNRVLGAPARAADGGGPPVLRLDGAMQRRGDREVYVFRNAQARTLVLDDSVLSAVRVTRCELGPAAAGGGGNAEADPGVVARFDLRGTLAFRELPGRDGGALDLFGYDALPFSGMGLEMHLRPDDPRDPEFSLDLTRVTFDADGAAVRPGSLPDRFPLRPGGLIQPVAGERPSALGWSTVQVPALVAKAPGGGWFGLAFELDLGTPGALADAVGLSAGFALVWSPSSGDPGVLVGLRLPGGSGGGAGVSLMGVLDLDVRYQRLLAVDGGWLLELTGMTLKLLGKALPPGATFDALLFGDPEGTSGKGVLGWYGAYRSAGAGHEEDEPELLTAWAPGLPPSGTGPGDRDDPGGADAPPPAWRARPWAWTLDPNTTEDGP